MAQPGLSRDQREPVMLGVAAQPDRDILALAVGAKHAVRRDEAEHIAVERLARRDVGHRQRGMAVFSRPRTDRVVVRRLALRHAGIDLGHVAIGAHKAQRACDAGLLRRA
jgi:hypothetical protein